MAGYYVDTNATGANNGTSWTDAYTSLAGAVVGKSAGDIFYVANNSAETLAANITFPGTYSNPNLVYSTTTTHSPPTSADLSAGASVTIDANRTVTGSVYFYGLTIPLNGLLTATLAWAGMQTYDTCTINATSNVPRITTGGNTLLRFVNCVLTPGWIYNGQGSRVEITGGSTTTFTGITTFFTSAAGSIIARGFDFSGNTNLTSIVNSATGSAKILLVDCKIPAISVIGGTSLDYSAIEVARTDSSGTNNVMSRYTGVGTQTVETTIVRSGGATDGTTPISWKLVTGAGAKWVNPLNSLQFQKNNTTTGSSVTATVYLYSSDGTLTNKDIWCEFEYLGNASYPLASFASTTVANNLATGTALTADGTSSWGGGLGYNAYKISTSFTPQMTGYVVCTVKCAKTSTTFYIDPKIYFS
jgi:hypothetical protein